MKNILNDPVYTGRLVQNSTGTRSYKDKTYVSKPESDWIVHEGAHAAVVSTDVWNSVQEINRVAKQRYSNSAPPIPSLFSGKLVCAGCGSPLVANRETQRRKNGSIKRYTSYCCSRYLSSGRCVCSSHRVYEIGLKELVLTEIKAQAQSVEIDEAAVLDRLAKQLSKSNAGRLDLARQEVTRLRRRLHELESMTARLYEDKVAGSLSEATFKVLIARCEEERRQKTERLEALNSEVCGAQRACDDAQKWASAIRSCLSIKKLDRGTVNALIDHIEVGERTVMDGGRHQDIRIYYRFVGAV